MIQENRTLQKETPEFILKHIWDSYALADDRRRKAFYHLFFIMAIFALLWVNKDESLELPLLETKVDVFVAMMLAPAFIAILTGRYLYLCAHSLMAYVQFVEFYMNFNQYDLQKLGYSFTKIYASFERRDSTEKVNIFLFPMYISKDWDQTINNFVGKAVVFICNIATLLTVAIPISAYAACFFWIICNQRNVLSLPLVIFVDALYFLIGVLLLLCPIYFFFRVWPARSIYRQHIR